MKVIVGLGNPGREYSATRHNVGFMVVDELARRWGVSDWRRRHEAEVAEYRGAGAVLLVKPQTYMNLSGRAVGEIARWYKLAAEDIIVVFDDLDLPVGRLRLRMKGSSGGHRGIESILAHLGADTFARVRVGIGRPPQGWATADYVLSKFTPDEAPLIEQAIVRAADAVETILKDGLNKAMNAFNK